MHRREKTQTETSWGSKSVKSELKDGLPQSPTLAVSREVVQAELLLSWAC